MHKNKNYEKFLNDVTTGNPVVAISKGCYKEVSEERELH